MAATDARPVPLKNTAFRLYFYIRDNDGDLVASAAALDSEVSIDGGAFTDCTNEATDEGQGLYSLDLTSSEMNGDGVAVITKTTTSDAKTAGSILYPQEADDIKVSVTHWLGTAAATPTVAGVPEVDVTHISGDATSLADLKDFADSGYDPATNKVEGVKLADSLTSVAADGIGAPAISAAAVEKILKSVSGTTDSGSTTTIVDTERAESVADYWKGCIVVPTSGPNLDIPRRISAFDQTTDTITVSPAWPSAMATGNTYIILRGAYAEVLVDAVKAAAINAAALANASIDLATFAGDVDTYQAKVWLFDDDAGTTDRYVVAWFKNGQPVLASITSPTIQVWKVSDGSDLIASTAMTEIGTTETYKYDATTTERIVAGAGYIAKVQATIDGSTRTWVQPVGRDSA